MRALMSTVFMALLLAAAVAPGHSSIAGAAEDAPPAVSSDGAPAAEAMAGCPGKADGSPCCTSCQDRQAKIAAGEAPAGGGGCPCQERARRLREAAERAKQ